MSSPVYSSYAGASCATSGGEAGMSFAAGGSPDALCQSTRPSGVTTAQAMIALTTRAARSVIDTTQNYVRPDGTLVGTGSLLVGLGDLQSGIWQGSNGAYHATELSVWTGQMDLSTVGTLATTCGNWTDPTGSGAITGAFTFAETPLWWSAITNFPCSQPGANVALYCVQVVP